MIKDNINPSHYKQGNRETIDIIKDITGDGFCSMLVGNIIKYISRYKYKNGVEDLKKARWYLDRLITENDSKPIPEPVEPSKAVKNIVVTCTACDTLVRFEALKAEHEARMMIIGKRKTHVGACPSDMNCNACPFKEDC